MKIKKTLFLLIPLFAFMLLACFNGEDSEEETKQEESTEVLTNLFDVEGFGFTISYPEDWIYQSDNNLVIFSGAEGTDEYFTTLNIQNLMRGEGGYEEIDDVYETYKEEFLAVGGEVTEPTEMTFEQDDEKYLMIKFEGTYTSQDQNFKQVIHVIERSDRMFHQITYTAPIDLFDLAEDTINEMFDSFKIIN